MKMVRVTIDLPYSTQLAALQKLATDQGCQLFRRADGTFAMRPRQPPLHAVSAESRA